MDFFEMGTQKVILRILNNVCQNVNSEQEFQKAVCFVPTLTMMLDAKSPSDRYELLSTILKRICESPLRFLDGYTSLEKVKQMMEEISQSGILTKIIEVLQCHASGLASNLSQLSLTCNLRSIGWLARYSSNIVRNLVHDHFILELISQLMQDEFEAEKTKNLMGDLLFLLDSLLPMLYSPDRTDIPPAFIENVK